MTTKTSRIAAAPALAAPALAIADQSAVDPIFAAIERRCAAAAACDG